MRALGLMVFAFLAACSSTPSASSSDDVGTFDAPSESSFEASSGDAGSDSTFDAPSYDSEDFSSFRYAFLGTGISGSFNMDRDCGIDADGRLSFGGPGVPTGSGVVAASD